jgi:hypothetical protein
MVDRKMIAAKLMEYKVYFDAKGGYRAAKMLHYSLLSSLDKNPKTIHQSMNRSTSFFDYGNLVEDMWMYPETWETMYVVPKIAKPTGQMEWYVDAYLYAMKQLIANPHEYAYEAATAENVKKSGKPMQAKAEKMLDRFKEEANAYCNFHIKNSDKVLISKEDMMEAKIAVEGLKNFDGIQELTGKGDVYFQVPLAYKLMGVDIKVLFDILIVTDEGIYGIDLKTMAQQLREFKRNYSKFKYYIQEGLYTKALLANFPDTEIDFKFLVSSRETPETPRLFSTANVTDHGYYMEDFIDSAGYTKKGILTLLKDYQWHDDNNSWNMPMEYLSRDEIYIYI